MSSHPIATTTIPHIKKDVKNFEEKKLKILHFYHCCLKILIKSSILEVVWKNKEKNQKKLKQHKNL